MDFTQVKIDDRLYLKSNLLPKKIKHCFTTKYGGISSGNIKGLNLGFNTKGDRKVIIENQKIVSKDMGFNFCDIILTNQNHSSNVLMVTEKDKGKGLSQKSDLGDVDALLTNETNLPIGMIMADCVPIMLVDVTKNVIGICHAGWRGTVDQILAKTIQKTKKEFDSLPDNILCVIGPCICKNCFKTDEENAKKFEKTACFYKYNEFFVDLAKCNFIQALKEGLLEKNISVLGECTCCLNDKYFSFRREGQNAGRMGAFIQIFE